MEYLQTPEKLLKISIHFPTTYLCKTGFSICLSNKSTYDNGWNRVRGKILKKFSKMENVILLFMKKKKYWGYEKTAFFF